MSRYRDSSNSINTIITNDLFLFFLFPVAILLLELVIRASLGDTKEFINSLGVSLSTIALATVFPLILSEKLLMAKIFFFRTEISFDKDSLKLQFNLKSNVYSEQYQKIKNVTNVVFVLSLVLFLLSILTNYNGENFFQKNSVGILNSIVVTAYFSQS